MRARKAAKQVKRSYRDPDYTVRNYQKCADTLVSRTRTQYKHLAVRYRRLSKQTKDDWDRNSYQNLSNYYWHQSAQYGCDIWRDVEEMWFFNK